jgi:hypothetical protein
MGRVPPGSSGRINILQLQRRQMNPLFFHFRRVAAEVKKGRKRRVLFLKKATYQG